MTEFNLDQTGRHTRLTLEGVDISRAVRGVTINVDVERVMRIELDLAIDTVEITSLGEQDHTMLVNIPSDVVEVLELLGWVKTDRRTYRVPRVEGDFG